MGDSGFGLGLSSERTQRTQGTQGTTPKRPLLPKSRPETTGQAPLAAPLGEPQALIGAAGGTYCGRGLNWQT
jgi:hypothetical protein